MKILFISFVVGLGVGILYGLIRVKSPAPPIVALLGLLGKSSPMPEPTRPQKITFAEMRESGVRGLIVYCQNYRCSHWIRISGDRWPDDLRLSDLENRFSCSACGQRGGDVRPDFATAPSPPSRMADRIAP